MTIAFTLSQTALTALLPPITNSGNIRSCFSFSKLAITFFNSVISFWFSEIPFWFSATFFSIRVKSTQSSPLLLDIWFTSLVEVSSNLSELVLALLDLLLFF